MVAPATQHRLELRRTFGAPPARLFEMWTTPEHMKHWFAPSAEYSNPFIEVDAREGGRYRIGLQAADGPLEVVAGRYVSFEPPHKLVLTWQWEAPHKFEEQETLVTVEFRPSGDGTELILTPDRFPLEEMLQEHNQGWNGALDRLVDCVTHS